jgi:hypothetical protein
MQRKTAAYQMICAFSLIGFAASCFDSSTSGDGGPAEASTPIDASDDVIIGASTDATTDATRPDGTAPLDSGNPEGAPNASTDATVSVDGAPEASTGEAGAACAGDSGKIYVADGLNNHRIVRIDDMCGTNWVALQSQPGADVATALGSPEGVFVDGAGKIYIADTFGGDRIVRIDDMTGTNWTTVGSTGSGALEFNAPKNVFVDSGGHIYVTDSFNYRIVRMDDMTGKNWTTFGTHGTGVDQFSFPTGIFVDGAGRIYVTDSDISNSFERVVRIDDMTGTNWTTFGTNGSGVNQFSALWGIFVDSTGHIYLADAGTNARVVRMDDMNGTNWTTYGTFGMGAVGDFYSPASIFVDGTGRIYVVDAANAYPNDNGVVRMDDMTGKNWIRFGKGGGGVGEFSQATGLWVH